MPENDAAPGRMDRGRGGDVGRVEGQGSDPLTFARRLAAQGVPIFVAPPGGSDEFQRPRGWQDTITDDTDAHLDRWRPDWAVMAVTGAALTVFDVDPRNGTTVEAAREWLHAHDIRIFAVVMTPGGGAHFYLAGDPRLHKATIDGLPGVDFQSAGCNVYLPGTNRPKYQGGGYTVMDDTHIDELSEGDGDGVDTLLAVVGHRRERPLTADVDAAEVAALFTEGDPDDVLTSAIDAAIIALSFAQRGSRHHALGTGIGRIIRHGASGRPGVAAALRKLEPIFVGAVGDRPDYDPNKARKEFWDRVNSMAREIAATPEIPIEVMAGPDAIPGPAATPSAAPDQLTGARLGFTGGGTFIHDEPEGFSPLWGSGDTVLMTEGEALMIAGPQGVGKTTLVINFVAAAIGDEPTDVLGMPVRPGQRVLYLAMDRPRQLARAMRRQLGRIPRDVLDDRLTVWRGPPPHDLARYPSVLADMADAANADIVVVDSLKDAALGLVDDEVGAGWNRARQGLLAAGRNVVEVHHNRKADPKRSRPTVDDVYGSTWLTSGAGSILMIEGQPGDAHVTAHHIKQPGDDVGPIRIVHDTTTGVMTVEGAVDLLAVVRDQPGITAHRAAQLLFDTGSPDRNQKAKAARRLDALVDAGHVEKSDGVVGGKPATYRAVMFGRPV